MTAAVYPSCVNAFLRGEIQVETDTVKAQLVGLTFAYDDTMTVAADITDTISTPVAVTVDHVADGGVWVDAVDFPAVTEGLTVGGVVLYVDSGSPATSPLLCHTDTGADYAPLAVVANGGTIRLAWPKPALKL